MCILGNDMYYSLIISATFYEYNKIEILSNASTWKQIIFLIFTYLWKFTSKKEHQEINFHIILE